MYFSRETFLYLCHRTCFCCLGRNISQEMYNLLTVWCPKPNQRGRKRWYGLSGRSILSTLHLWSFNHSWSTSFFNSDSFSQKNCVSEPWIRHYSVDFTPPSAFKGSGMFIAIHHLYLLPPATLSGGAWLLVLHQVKEAHTRECTHFISSTGVCQRLVSQKEWSPLQFLVSILLAYMCQMFPVWFYSCW